MMIPTRRVSTDYDAKRHKGDPDDEKLSRKPETKRRPYPQKKSKNYKGGK